MILNINQLRSFYTAAKSGSITKAAETLMVTPAAITLQIKQLQENTGVPLLIRAGNAMRLTDTGEAVFERAQKIFEQIQNLEVFMADIGKGESGFLRIGCSETAAVYILPKAIKVFKRHYPGIRVVIDRGSSEDMVNSLLDHKIELAVVRFRADEKIKMERMGKKEIILIAAPESRLMNDQTIAPEDFGRIPLIVPLKGSATREIVHEYLKNIEVHPKVVIESSSVALTTELVREGEGVSFLCRDVVADDLSKGRLVEVNIPGCSLSIEYGIGYLNSGQLSRASLAFLQLVEEAEDPLL